MTNFLYNPGRKGKDLLISEFVVRTRVYDEIMHDLETSPMEHPEQHYLLVGQRGTGKTTLLNRIKYGIEDSGKLNSWLIPILFTEEQYNISELANLWENIAQYLEDYQGFGGLCEHIEKHLDKNNFEELAFDLVEKYLHQHKKNLVLLIDNIGDLLKKLDKTEVHRLREILQTKKEIRLIAASPFNLESILDYHQPLFEFFKVVRLDGLNQQETESLLLKLGEIHGEKEKIERIIRETPERISTLTTLTGGVPRTIALMFTIFVDYNEENTIKDLERILDAVTPLYKHRMDDLPAQQQKIMDAVAKNWDAISVKELKEKVRLESKIISAQLRQLEKNQVIEKKETGTKNHLYFVKERFFNIWYLMRYGRKDDRQRVIWLVRFLESWCSSSEITSRILDYAEKINTGGLDNSTKELFGQVYAAFTNLDPEIKLLLKNSVPENISTKIIFSENEVFDLLKKYEKEEKWNSALKLVLENYYPTTRIKRLILNAVNQIAPVAKQNEVILHIINKTNKAREFYTAKDKKSEEDNNLFFNKAEIEILKCINIAFTILSIELNELDMVYESIDSYLGIIKFEKLNNDTFEFEILNLILFKIIAHGHYNLLFKLFNERSNFNLIEMFKPVYFALIYLKEGKDSPEFLKSGPELQPTITEIIKAINKYRENNKEILLNAE